MCAVLCCSPLPLDSTPVAQVFNPRLFIVKSFQLKRLINRCQLFFCESNHQRPQQQLAAHAEGAAGAASDGSDGGSAGDGVGATTAGGGGEGHAAGDAGN